MVTKLQTKLQTCITEKLSESEYKVAKAKLLASPLESKYRALHQGTDVSFPFSNWGQEHPARRAPELNARFVPTHGLDPLSPNSHLDCGQRNHKVLQWRCNLNHYIFQKGNCRFIIYPSETEIAVNFIWSEGIRPFSDCRTRQWPRNECPLDLKPLGSWTAREAWRSCHYQELSRGFRGHMLGLIARKRWYSSYLWSASNDIPP